MRIIDEAYKNTDAEYQEICEFLNSLSTKDPYMLWESGRMNFWRYNVHANKDPQDAFFGNNVHIWRSDNQEIIGLCISEYGENDLFVEVLPDYHDIYPDIFRWIHEHWAANREEIVIDIFGADQKKIAQLNKFGYAFQCHHENKRYFYPDEMNLDYQLEDGFTIQMFSESNDYAGIVALVQSAFDNPGYNEVRLRGLISSPDYIDEYHLMVVSPDNQPVAYCIGWHSAEENSGYIEPVGTHADFRQRGFAKAINKECFSRMKANGIKVVEIASMAVSVQSPLKSTN